MDPWDTRQLWKDFLELLPYLAAFMLGGIYSTVLVRLVVRKARKKWDADYLTRQSEEARKQIEGRDAHIADLQGQLREAHSVIAEQAAARKAATRMSVQVSEILATAPPTRTYQHG